MKFKFILGATLFICVIALLIGLYQKSFYKDFNEQENPMENFVVALMGDELLDIQLQFFDENLDSSSIIIAAKCEETFDYKFSCNTQKVTVEHVFKGDTLKTGDSIDIARSGSCIYTDKKDYVHGRPINDMGFVNEMIPGKTYLIFLERQMQTYNRDNVIYIQSDMPIFAPIFCYEKIENTPCESIDPVGNFAYYESVENNEYFLMSESAVEKMENYKKKLFLKYSY